MKKFLIYICKEIFESRRNILNGRAGCRRTLTCPLYSTKVPPTVSALVLGTTSIQNSVSVFPKSFQKSRRRVVHETVNICKIDEYINIFDGRDENKIF